MGSPRTVIEPYRVPCRSPLWARHGHAQTLFAYGMAAPGEALEPSLDGGVERHEVPVSGDDRLVVMDAAPLRAGVLDGAVVHLMHGLTGSTESNYMRMCAAVLRRVGARVIGFNHRGQGPGAGLAKGLYNSGSFRDMWAAVAHGRQRHPGGVHIAVGFSLSANTSLLGITEKGDVVEGVGLPDAVLAVNPPVDLRRCVIRIETGVNRLYDRNFVRGMRESLGERHMKGWVSRSIVIPKGASVRGADEAVTAPLAGYGSADEYYADCSSGTRLATLRRPAVILSSEDDPFVGADDIQAAAEGTSAFVHIEPRGGHLGYLTKSASGLPQGLAEELPGIERRWLAGAVPHYVEQLLHTVG